MVVCGPPLMLAPAPVAPGAVPYLPVGTLTTAPAPFRPSVLIASTTLPYTSAHRSTPSPQDSPPETLPLAHMIPIPQGWTAIHHPKLVPTTSAAGFTCSTLVAAQNSAALQQDICTPLLPPPVSDICSLHQGARMIPVSVSPPLSMPPPSLYSASPATPWKQSYGMERVWQSQFQNLFTRYQPHFWMLFPVTSKPEGTWAANVDSAKVRFCCDKCGHGWTSMKGRVAFWFILNPATGEGYVCVKLYGQQCDRCKTGNYEPAMWYPEEVLKVLVNIYNRVGQYYYGFQQAPFHKTRRAGKPRTPHNSELCQACKDGVCSERR